MPKAQGGRLRSAGKRRHVGAKLAEADASALAAEESFENSLTLAMNKRTSQASHAGVVQAILEVGNQRRAILVQLRTALVSGHDSEALRHARRLCGLAA